MKYLKKIFVSSVIMSSVAYAEFVSDIHIGISNAKVLDESYTEFNGGYGFNKYFDSNIVVGTSINFAYGNPNVNSKNIDVYTLSGDLKIGYAIFNQDLFVYTIGSGALQGIDNKDGAGFGYGAGADYRITKNIALNFEYKIYNMTSSRFDYDYEKANLNLKYTF
ncbi:outer membrane beta-barrel protein (plasmid) [Arcobacter cryaerophilus gv. pseudocryaerophilus]|uniref:Outer membrane beta-barrel protein n=3 Tax=Arcobacteraceae TaxID=2808963 RepID=A0AA96DV50_9BACT|nr:outer membrane beta-barrel protein [Arcobacter sp. AZ-2023]WPD12474.1 outer membrane beta-barrel protein [Arcobacter sp. DSM 115960]WNL35166.1 outer membrane beta-barrel protein [Arcobacter sp. AZ-2023]WNL36758.1 outer membrane beta-barrel protein [Arcobacter sp. AZ-2023]WNL37353.1 outer membrane beta-barrel protein [Arcobacter sp. AZ-2023]